MAPTPSYSMSWLSVSVILLISDIQEQVASEAAFTLVKVLQFNMQPLARGL